MHYSQKSQYALRAIFELARRKGEGPTRIADISKEQDIPHRFLEAILSEMRRGGFVASQRGRDGGYVLVRDPEGVTVSEILAFIDGPLAPVQCLFIDNTDCALRGTCIFEPMWQRVREAMEGVLGKTTIADLIAAQAKSPC